MPFVRRTSRTELSAPLISRAKPLTRACPDCQASIGQRCWSLRNTTFPQRIQKFHPGRRVAG